MALSDFDLYLFGTGTHRQAYRHLGAHIEESAGQSGVSFAVWAPNAEEVSVVGDFNHWVEGKAQLAPTGSTGIWQGFFPGLGSGDRYKYAVRPRGQSSWLQKADPYAFAAELRPRTASIVADLSVYRWNDEEWVSERRQKDWRASAMSVYEVHLGSWRRDPTDPERFLTYRELAAELPGYAQEMGYTHIELLPISEHPLDMSWGYQVTGYFAPTARFGPPEDFMYFIDECHRCGIGVILDWVPAHFPKDAHGLALFDSTHLYEHADPRKGEHPDWGTLIFNFGRSEVRSFLLSNALFWIDRYHIDGLRVDAVASMLYLDYSRNAGQWIPNEYGGRENLEALDFLRQVNTAVHEDWPGALTLAEESTAWPKVTGSPDDGGLGFDLKWNMGWMHDTLQYFDLDPIYRQHHQNDITFSMTYAMSERFILPLSHDEVVHGKKSLLDKMPGDVWQKFANLRLLLTYMVGHPGKKLLFMGADIGQFVEWNHERSIDWHLISPGEPSAIGHVGIHRLVRELNHLYTSMPALHEADFEWDGFEWIDNMDANNSVIIFGRKAKSVDARILFVFNFTPVVRHGYRIGLPTAGQYREILNSDSERFGGSGVSNTRPLEAEPVPWHGQPLSVAVTLPPLASFLLQLT